MDGSADYVVVGAGSAGCALAARLSEGGRHRVLLLEAGPRDDSPWIHFPLGLQKALADERLEWRLSSGPEPDLAGRRVPSPRGRVCGGSSAMNGMIYIRGTPADYEAWARAGCTGWGWRDVLPAFLRSEGNLTLPAGELHAVDGPLRVTTPEPGDPLCEALIAAGEAMGVPRTADFNGPSQEGVGYYQHTLAQARRWSAARAYLHPARSRTNLVVRPGTQAMRIVFEGRRAVGVEIAEGGARRTVRAAREVIVCAGAYHSPQLLQCSGIGDAGLLGELGVPVVQHAPAVGENLQDHVQARLRYVLAAPLGLNALAHSRGRLAIELARYALLRRGRCAAPPIRAGMFCRSDPALDAPDLQFHFIEFTVEAMGRPPHPWPGFWSSVCVLRPRSRGTVRAASADMREPPRILGRYLSDPQDAAGTVSGVRLARRLARHPALAELIREEAEPGPGAGDDAAVLDWVRRTAVTVYHPVGTCRMGGDAASVVDPRLRVRGVAGLRVADASVMPTLVSGNTNAPAIMIGERCADFLLADAA